MTELVNQNNLAEYESFVQSHPKGHFAQSSLWAKQKPAWTWQAILCRGEDGKIKVYMLPEEVTKGIGRGGVNIKLAGMLVDKEIEVWRDTPKTDTADADEEDVLLDEFDNEIDQWIIDKLKSIGCDTAKSVLAIAPDDLARRADLEDETVEDIRKILSAEFE